MSDNTVASELYTLNPRGKSRLGHFDGIIALKAVGVLLIMLHHYCRSLWGVRYLPMLPLTQWQLPDTPQPPNMHLPGPIGFFLEFMAQYGFLGVHMFILASGIGLGIKYAEAPPAWGPFFRRRVTKIVLPAWVSLAVFFVYESATRHDWGWGIFLRKLSMASFFIEEEFFAINAPLWFIPLILQLYFLFPLLLWLAKRYPWRGFLLLLVLSIWYRGLMRCDFGNCDNSYLAHGMALNWLAVFYAGILCGYRAAKAELPDLNPWLWSAFGVAAFLLYGVSQLGRTWYPLADNAFGLGILCLVVAWPAVSTFIARWAAPVAANSYGAYLYHRPIFEYVAARWTGVAGDHAGWLLAGGIAASLIMLGAVALVRRLASKYPWSAALFFGG